jgi:hypothetical protein
LVTSAPGATTVAVTNGEATFNTDSILKVFVITGHDPVTPIGGIDSNRQDSGSSLSDTYTATISGSQGFMVICDYNAGDPTGWTPTSGCTITDIGTNAGWITYAVVQRTSPDGILGVPTPIGLTGLPTGGQYHWVIVEVVSHDAVVAAATTAGYPARGANAPMF